MHKKLLGMVALTFIPATLAGTIHTNVGLGFRVGPVDLGLNFTDDCPCCYDDCQECCTCSRIINDISSNLYAITMELPEFKYTLDRAGVCYRIQWQIDSQLRDICSDWRSYANHCCCVCPGALADIKQATHDMLRAMRTARNYYTYATEDNARDARDALDTIYHGMLNRVPTDRLADDFEECARCMRRL